MQPAAYRIAVVTGVFAAAAAVALASTYRADTPEQPSLAPPGWTVSCEQSALGRASRLPLMACRTYPPGDDRWMPAAPVPPQRPLPTPWPGGEDAR